MAEERTNTEAYETIEAGTYILTVIGKPEKIKTAKSHYRIWKFGLLYQDRPKTIKIFLFPWESEDLLLAVGGKKDGKDVVWDPEEVDKIKIKAEIVYKPDLNGKERMKLGRVKALQENNGGKAKKGKTDPEENSNPEDGEEVPF